MKDGKPTAEELAATVRAGIDAYRALPDDTATRFDLPLSFIEHCERERLLEGSTARSVAKAALDQLLALALKRRVRPAKKTKDPKKAVRGKKR